MSSASQSSDRWQQVIGAAPCAPVRSVASGSSSARPAATPRRIEKFSEVACFTARPHWGVPQSARQSGSTTSSLGRMDSMMSNRSGSVRRAVTARDLMLDNMDPTLTLEKAHEMLVVKLAALDKLDSDLQNERKDTSVHLEAQEKFANMRTIVAFLRRGGEVPDYLFDVKIAKFTGGDFITRVPELVGGFLVTKSFANPAGEPRPRQALYRVQGVYNGLVALKKFRHSGPVDPDIKKVAHREPEAPGGWVADAKLLQKFLHVIEPSTLKAWAQHMVVHDAEDCENAMRSAVEEEHTRNERLKEANIKWDLYTARGPWRTAMKSQRGDLLRELWATLWQVNFPRVQSMALALRRIGISMSDKIFHEVTVSGYGADRFFVFLEEAGATSDELQFEWKETMQSETVTFTRRHSQLSALDAYDCMRGDNAAPPGIVRMRQWLLEQCGAPTRSQWGSQFLTRSPGRNMMVGKSFVQRILVDLINKALDVRIPDAPESANDLPSWYNGRAVREAAISQVASPTSPRSPARNNCLKKQATRLDGVLGRMDSGSVDPRSMTLGRTSVDSHRMSRLSTEVTVAQFMAVVL